MRSEAVTEIIRRISGWNNISKIRRKRDGEVRTL